ncbi:MAG: RagB/SusD family nutrient uptake outer membrane protein, partial [Muribaculaceae bacterium]|nr:RagB/SusD family nutrient uptake outer membrane protein [Muribaculaceae bacterium]
LFNGEFPYKDWTNKVETPGYGREMVSRSYDREKWERARKASEEALALAMSAGNRELYNDNNYADVQKIDLPYVPVEGASDDFKKAVLRMRNVMTALETDGNHEWIWSVTNYQISHNTNYRHRVVRNPVPADPKILPNGFTTAYCACGATLGTVERFLTVNGLQPGNDPDFAPESEWFKSAGLKDENGALRSHIINLNVNREPRFYAWLSFDGGDYGTLMYNGERPVHVNMLSSTEQGIDPSKAPRDYCATGFPMQKWIHPQSHITTAGKENYYVSTGIVPLIRLAELYLNLAECNAELGNTQQALDNINIIRRRAGATELTAAMVNNSGKSLVEWARDERSIELFDEMHRFFDVRRWCKGDLLGNGTRKGLNTHDANPSFEQFNTVIDAKYPYVWADRMYLYPIDDKELYSNPQFVQSPGY